MCARWPPPPLFGSRGCPLAPSQTVTERRVGMPGALASTPRAGRPSFPTPRSFPFPPALPPSLQHLEMSLLAFLQHFRRVHIGAPDAESPGNPSNRAAPPAGGGGRESVVVVVGSADGMGI